MASTMAGRRRLQENTVVPCQSGAYLHRLLRVVHTVVTPGRFISPNLERTEVAVSGNDLSQTKREDAEASHKPFLKKGPYSVSVLLILLVIFFGSVK